MIEQELYEILKNSIDLVEGRVYPQILPQSCIKPALVYTVLSDLQEQGIDGAIASNPIRVQIDVYSTKSYLQAKEIAKEVRASLVVLEAFNIHIVDGFEEEHELFRQIIQFNTRKNYE